MYKKFLEQSQSSGEEWASKVVRSISNVKAAASRIRKLVDGIKSPAVAEACTEVMNMQLPPRKRSVPSKRGVQCAITGVQLGSSEEVLEIVRRRECRTKKRVCAGAAAAASDASAPVLTAHARFHHFFSMLWLVCKLDHILKNLARAWTMPPSCSSASHTDASVLDAEKRSEARGIDMCQTFLEHHADTIQSLGIMFMHALSHVEQSLMHERESKSSGQFSGIQ